MPARRDSFLLLTFNLFPRVTCQGTAFTSHSSSPAPRSLASSVLGETPSFSAARVLFHLHSRMVFSSKTFSTWFAARPVTSSSEPSQLKFSASMPAGRCSVSGFEKRSEEHTSELQSQFHLVCRLLLEKKNNNYNAELPIRLP